MKKIVALLFFILTTNCFSQDTIPTAKAKDYINNLVCVTGKVVSYKLASEGKNTNYINLDVAYPNTVFTVIMTNDYLEKNKIDIAALKDKTIYVYGKITVYINDPKQTPQIFNPRRIDIKK
jgi:RPA family protein